MAPKIYHLHPLVAGDLADWPSHFERCCAMGFDTVCLAPPFVPGANGDIFVTADREALHPALGWPGTADAGIERITRTAEDHGLHVWLDLTIDQVAMDAPIRSREEQWFALGGCGAPPNPLGRLIGWTSPMRGCSRPMLPRRWPYGGWTGCNAWFRRVSQGSGASSQSACRNRCGGGSSPR